MSDAPDLVRRARELAKQGLDDYQVANQLFNPSDPIRSCHAVARALYSPSGLDLSECRVAKVLHHEKGLGLPLETVARALYHEEGANISGAGVAWTLHHEEGLGLPLEMVARALYHKKGANISGSSVACSLHHGKGLGLAVERVAWVLHHKEGANLSPAKVAKALIDAFGVEVPPHKLVPVLATITSTDEALFKAAVPLLRWGYFRPEDRLALMDVLLHHLPTERSLPLLATAILAGKPPVYSPETLARLFAAEDGLDLPPQAVVYALTHQDGPRLSLDQVASILTADTGLALTPNVAAEALACGAALDSNQARRIVDDGMDSGHVATLQRDEDKPKLAVAVSRNPLVR